MPGRAKSNLFCHYVRNCYSFWDFIGLISVSFFDIFWFLSPKKAESEFSFSEWQAWSLYLVMLGDNKTLCIIYQQYFNPDLILTGLIPYILNFLGLGLKPWAVKNIRLVSTNSLHSVLVVDFLLQYLFQANFLICLGRPLLRPGPARPGPARPGSLPHC